MKLKQNLTPFSFWGQAFKQMTIFSVNKFRNKARTFFVQIKFLSLIKYKEKNEFIN